MIDIIKNGEISIPEEEWTKICSLYSKDELKKLISDTIRDNNLELPYQKITENEALEDFKALCVFDTASLIKEGKFVSRYPYKYEFSNKYIDTSYVGNKSSNYFQQKNRFVCDSINAPSPYRTWTEEKFRLTLLNALWTLKPKKIDNDVLRGLISLRKYIASQFKPSSAKCIYQMFDSKNTLDFSSGWGDRLAGFSASSGKSYTGIDPNESVYEKYKDQIKFYSQNKDYNLINSPAEDISEYDKTFDLIFTSPPYFDIERYSKDSSQSWKRYKKFNDWLENFLFKTIATTWDYLDKDGHMAINISDVYCHHKINNICDPMNDFISTLNGAKYEGAIGMRMAKRPNSKAFQEGIFAEPVWVWKKT